MRCSQQAPFGVFSKREVRKLGRQASRHAGQLPRRVVVVWLLGCSVAWLLGHLVAWAVRAVICCVVLSCVVCRVSRWPGAIW